MPLEGGYLSNYSPPDSVNTGGSVGMVNVGSQPLPPQQPIIVVTAPPGGEQMGSYKPLNQYTGGQQAQLPPQQPPMVFVSAPPGGEQMGSYKPLNQYTEVDGPTNSFAPPLATAVVVVNPGDAASTLELPPPPVYDEIEK